MASGFAVLLLLLASRSVELLPLAGVLAEAPGTMSYYFVHIEKQCGEHLFFGCRLEQSGLDVEIILVAGI